MWSPSPDTYQIQLGNILETHGAREVAQWLRVLATLAKDSGFPRFHEGYLSIEGNSSSRESNVFSGLQRFPHACAPANTLLHTYSCAHIHKQKEIFKSLLNGAPAWLCGWGVFPRDSKDQPELWATGLDECSCSFCLQMSRAARRRVGPVELDWYTESQAPLQTCGNSVSLSARLRGRSARPSTL